MMLYKVMLCLFIFGLVAGAVNESGLSATVTVPYSNVEITEADAQDLTEGIGNGGINALSLISAVFVFGRVIGSAALAVFTILPILLAFGVPEWIAIIIQAPIWLVEIIGLYQLYTGHQMIGMD